jgi:hypothetical protein
MCLKSNGWELCLSHTTGHSCFAEGKILCRAHFLGHSAKEIFAECQIQKHSAKKCPRQSSLSECQALGKGGPSTNFFFAEGWELGKFWPSAKVAGVTAR